MSVPEWVEAERIAAGACPSCSAEHAMSIVYGMPTEDDFHSLRDRLVFAGCCLPEVLSRWSCGECGTTWGETRLGD